MNIVMKKWPEILDLVKKNMSCQMSLLYLAKTFDCSQC